MNNLQVFQNDNFKVRVVERSGEPWFVAKDVCDTLAIANGRDAISRLDEDEKDTVGLTDGTPGNPNMTIVSESGLYSLVLGSRKAEAKAFKRWVTHDVIPSIRKHGAYLTPEKIEEVLLNPDTLIRLATELKAEREARLALETEVKEAAVTIETQSTEIQVLTKEAVSTDTLPKITEIIRRVGIAAYAQDYHGAWTDYYNRLKYKYGIDPSRRKKARKSDSKLSTIKPKEYASALQVAAGMAKYFGVEIADILTNSFRGTDPALN